MFYDENINAADYSPPPKTEQDFQLHREWARKKSLEILARTKVGKKMAKLTRGKRK